MIASIRFRSEFKQTNKQKTQHHTLNSLKESHISSQSSDCVLRINYVQKVKIHYSSAGVLQQMWASTTLLRDSVPPLPAGFLLNHLG